MYLKSLIKQKNTFISKLIILSLFAISIFMTGCLNKNSVKNTDYTKEQKNKIIEKNKYKKRNKLFLMGIGMLRLNWTKVKGDEIRFRYSDLGLPTDFSTRERASFTLNGMLGNDFKVDGHLNYDPENRITEPPLDFLFTISNDKTYFSVGDYRMGIFLDSVFSRYYHPFRGAIFGIRKEHFGFELVGGMARGESGIDEIAADSGAGPYYLYNSPILRGSEIVFLVVKSASNPDVEIKREPLIRNKDYYIDYDRGEIIFNYPLYSYDELGNPVYIFVKYQYESLVGRFTRDVFGFRSYISPFSFLKLNFSYIADADGTIPLKDAIRERRGIYTIGINIDSKPLTMFGELSFSKEPSVENQNGFFGGGILNISRKIHFYFNSWSLDTNFPTFANEQLKYGYSLYQIFPSYSQRTIFLSPFQFTRNLGGELYPFSMSRISVSEKETNGFLEWENDNTRISGGYGFRKGITDNINSNTGYISAFHDGEKTKYWGKVEYDKDYDESKTLRDSLNKQFLLGFRQRVFSISKGSLYIQTDFNQNNFDDFLYNSPSTIHRTASFFTEYLTDNEGFFAGYRKESITNSEDDTRTLERDIYEIGIRKHIVKHFFIDSRYREENAQADNISTDVKLISLGLGLEYKKIRVMGRYEVQVNNNDSQKQKRQLISLFVFGSPTKRMNLSLRYYKRKGMEESILPSSETSEDELSFRLLWRPSNFLSLYSQLRYDTNIELYPPLDRTKSNSIASIQGLKLNFSRRFEFLANYKYLKVWGPIENKKSSISAELGYLLQKHFRFSIGVERIDFEDKFDASGNYKSTVGYFKLIALF